MPPSDREVTVVSVTTRWSLPEVRIRPYERRDAGATRVVFQESVQERAALDYEDDQREVWARGAGISVDEWHGRRSAVHTYVAVMSYQVVGFCDVDDHGYIDMLFVAPSAGGMGIGAALLNEVEQHYREAIAAERVTCHHPEARSVMTAHVSLTAQRVFERQGFVVTEHRRVVIDGVDFHNLLMVKQL